MTETEELALLRQVAEVAKCEHCGTYFGRSLIGTKRRFCKDAHKQAAHRKSKKEG